MDNEVVVTYQVWQFDECQLSTHDYEQAIEEAVRRYSAYALGDEPKLYRLKTTLTQLSIDHLA